MSYLDFLAQMLGKVSLFSSSTVWSTQGDSRPDTHRKSLAITLAAACSLSLAGSGSAHAQTATVNWTNVHQVIDGFGGSDAFTNGSMSSANQAFFFGTGSGQLGLSILRVAVPDNGGIAGDCASVGKSCAGTDVIDMQAVIANGGRVYATPWSPPAIYKTNGSVDCSAGSGSGALVTTDYALYAIWLTNFVQSLRTEYGITLYAISVQNEPEGCHSYDSALWSARNIDAFVKTNLGPAVVEDGLSTLIFAPEANYTPTNTLGASCGSDLSCNQYVGGFNFHDYDANLSGTNTIAADPFPSGWPIGKKYWETEASCGTANFCQPGFNTDITDALDWAAVVDQRLVVDGANAWLYWWLIDENSTDDQGLVASNGTVAQRAYMLGQYSKFVRPGYYRIDATHLPQTGVSVSAYQNKSTNTLAIIATNYTGSAVSQTFNLTNAPTFAALTPTITSGSLSLAAQSNVSLSAKSFTYTLPARSITTFVGTASTPPPPTNLSGMVVR